MIEIRKELRKATGLVKTGSGATPAGHGGRFLRSLIEVRWLGPPGSAVQKLLPERPLPLIIDKKQEQGQEHDVLIEPVPGR